jgi:hypothetical protein
MKQEEITGKSSAIERPAQFEIYFKDVGER